MTITHHGQGTTSTPMTQANPSPGLRLFLSNANDAFSKMGDITYAAKTLDPDIIVITETKFTAEKVSQSEAHIAGYSDPFRLDRTAHGGGVAVWVKTGVAVVQLEQPARGGHEIVWLKVRDRGARNIILGAAYRPGSCSYSDISLLEYVDEYLASLDRTDSYIVMAGDFNVHNESWLHSSHTTTAGQFLEDVCITHGLTQHVDFPTRGVNTLDLVLSDYPFGVQATHHAPLGKSDHCCILASFPQLSPPQEPTSSRRVWRYNRADWPRFRHFLRSTDWDTILTGTPDESCTNLTAVISQGMRQFIPSKLLTVKASIPPWWSPECSAATSAKQRAWQKWRKVPSCAGLRSSFLLLTQRCASQIHTAYSAHRKRTRNKINSGSLRDKAWWGTVKQLSGQGRSSEIPLLVGPDGSEHVTSVEKANCFGEHFAKKCSLGDMDLTPSSLPAVLPCPTNLNKIHFRVASVKRLLARLDASKATGPDEIPARVLKECAAVLASPVTRLFVTIFTSGVQPGSWKLARVIPVHKRGSKSQTRNFRPVSLLPILSKVFESIVNTQLVNYLDHHRLLSENQYGFRKRLGTSDLLTALHHEWVDTVGSGGYVRVLAVDIAGAFDRVSHPGLLHKMTSFGVSGLLHSWLQSYLSDRSIKVAVGGRSSSSFPISSGVPQGSILGPTLFLLYINDLEQQLDPAVSIAVYADDTTLYTLVRAAANMADAHAALQGATTAISDWGTAWRVSFEPTKSQAMTITRKTHTPPTPPLRFTGTAVPEEQQLKLLGVTFDSQLSFRSHLRSLAIRANQRLVLLRKAARYLDSPGILTVYKGFVRPVLEYSPLVWMGAAHTNLQLLDRVQHKAMHIIGPNILLPSLAARRHVAGLTYLYKLFSSDGPHRLLALLPPPAASLPASNTARMTRQQAIPHHNFQFHQPLPRHSPNFLMRSFPYCLIEEWNNLPPTTLSSRPTLKSLQGFKCKVNDHVNRTRWLWATDYTA